MTLMPRKIHLALPVLLAVSLYLPVRGFARLKQRRRDIRWLKYF